MSPPVTLAAKGYAMNWLDPVITTMDWASSVALEGSPLPSVSWYATNRAVLPTSAVLLGQNIWMVLRAMGYEPVGGLKRLSQMAAVSVVAVPNTMVCSPVPSSSMKLIGS